MMTDNDRLSRQQQLRQQVMRDGRQRQFERIVAQQQQKAVGNSTNDNNNLFHDMADMRAYDDIPIMDPSDLDLAENCVGQNIAFIRSFESACRNGPVSTVESMVSSETRTPYFLHYGLTFALSAGNVESASYLLSAGAPIARRTPNKILSAPLDKQIALFELLTCHNWTPNSYDGALLLPEIVSNHPLLGWFLAHGADPNLGHPRPGPRASREPDTKSCVALETAAGLNDIQAVRILLDCGAEIRNGVPLQSAAGACPPDKNPHVGGWMPSKEFDESRIPIMALLVERGADVNQKSDSPYVEPKYAIVQAAFAGAIERVKWLLNNGADPEVGGTRGDATRYAIGRGDEMKRVIEDGVKAWRLAHSNSDAVHKNA